MSLKDNIDSVTIKWEKLEKYKSAESQGLQIKIPL